MGFSCEASNLVPGDTNFAEDVFLRDRKAGTTVRLSLAADGTQAYGSCYGASISPDGRYVRFTSDAPNLVPGDTNGWADVFWLDRQTARLAMVSASKDGRPGNGASDTGIVSANGRYVTYSGQPTNGFAQVYVRDLTLKTTTLVSVGADGRPGSTGTFEATISASGRYVSFTTGATNIVPGSPFFFNTYVRDLSTTRLASLTYTGAPIQESTLDGQMTDAGLVFVSFAANVVADTVGRTEEVYFRSR